jgi:predicted GIY-YIG superfamily endonuclease
MKACSVYWIHHPDHSDMLTQGYIGVSKNAKQRFVQHLKDNQNRHLMFAIKKYGWDTLVKCEILIAKEDYCLDIEKKLRPSNGIGWNIAIGGGKPPVHFGHKRLHGNAINKGKKRSLEMRKKMSEINKVRLQDEAYREKFTKARVGISPANKGIPNSKYALEKMRLKHKENAWTCPHCLKSGFNKGSGNRWHFDNCKEKE